MALPVACPGCGATIEAKEEWVGFKIPCPKCRHEVTVVASSTSPADAASHPHAPAAHTQVPKPAHKPMVKAKRLDDAAPAAPASEPLPAPVADPLAGFQLKVGGAPSVAPKVAANPVLKPAAKPTVNAAATPAVNPVTTAAVKPAAKPKPKVVGGSGAPGAGLPLGAKIGAGAVAVVLLLGCGYYLAVRSLNKGNAGEQPTATVVEPAKPTTTKPAAAKPAVAKPSIAAVVAPTVPAAAPTKTIVSEELADVVERVKPSIVLISLFDAQDKELGLGTGFVVGDNGLVATNFHVIEGATRATARFSNGVVADVKGVVRGDRERDLAVIQLTSWPDGLKPLSFATTATLRQGAKVVAIGHPGGLDYSVTEGIISAVRATSELPEAARDFLAAPTDQQWIQTTAAISGGNSGGPLMLPDGQVIGINTWSAPGENLGFAGHVKHVHDLIANLPSSFTYEPLADYNEKHGGLKRGAMNPEEAIAAGLQTLFDEADQIDWQPTGDENALKIENIIGAVSIARTKNLAAVDLDSIASRLSAKSWDFAAHVEKLNANTIRLLDSGGRTAIAFGRITALSQSEPKRFILQLIGRGHELEVVNMISPATPHQIGDEVMIMGIQVQKMPQLGDIHRVAAGMIAKTAWTPPPDDIVMQECADYYRLRRKFDVLKKTLVARYDTFPEIKPNPDVPNNRNQFELRLNRTGRGFDAIRVPGTVGKSDDDLALRIVAPPNSIEDWGITSVDGTIPNGFTKSYEFNDFAPLSATWPKNNVGYFQICSGKELKDSKKHLLWFKFRDDKPVVMHVMSVYLLEGAVPPSDHEPLLRELVTGPMVPSVTRTLKQVSFDRAPEKATSQFVASPAGNTTGGTSTSGLVTGSVSAIASRPKDQLARVELPGFKPDEISSTIAVGAMPKPAEGKVELINPDQPQYSAITGYELAAAPDGWSIESVSKKGERKKVARLFTEAESLKFQWAPGTTRADGGALRNCVVRITAGGPEQTIVLRALSTRQPLVLDFKKDLERLSIGEDLPADAGLKLVIEGMDKVPEGAAVSDAPVPFKTAAFAVLKSAENDVPGARIRLVLWKTGLKTELIMRPELTPIATPQNLAVLKTNTKPGAKTTDTGDETDPTASNNQRFLSYTIKGLAGAKTMLENQLAMIREQIINNEQQINGKNAQLESFNISLVGATQSEIAAIRIRIAQLRNEIVSLQNETALLNKAIPGYLKQLDAFPPLEALGNSLHLTAAVRFRVVYQAGKYEVPLLHVGKP